MKHELINNYDNIDKDGNNPFDVLTEMPKDLHEDPQLSNEHINALIGSLKSKLANRDIYENVLPEEYFDEVEQTIKNLEERQRSIKQDEEDHKIGKS
jgi:hypothetical protein